MLRLQAIRQACPRMGLRVLQLTCRLEKQQFSMRVSSEECFRVTRLVLIVLVLMTALCAGLHTVCDSDMGWHLATGRWVVEHRQIPRTDVLSFTSSGTPWMYPPFAGVLLYLIYNVFGYAGLSWFCALACLAVVAYLVRRGDVGSAVLAMLAVGSIATRTAARADLFSTVFFALFLGELWAYQRGMRSRIWLLPVIMLFWVNLHPGFIAGLAAIGAYLLMGLSDLLFAERRQAALLRLRAVCPWLAACGVATLVNPWGARIYEASLNMVGTGGSSQGKINGNIAIAEFMGVPISAHLLYQLIDVRHAQFGFTWLLLLAVILAGFFFWKRQIGAGLVLLVALYAALNHARYSALFAICVVTLGGGLLDRLFADRISLRGSGKNTSPAGLPVPTSAAVLLIAALCAVALLQTADFVSNHTYVVFNPDLRFGAGEASWFPARAAGFIRDQHLPGNIFEDYELGGYAAWSLGPKYPDFIDGRGNNPDLGIEQFNLYSQDPNSQAWKSEGERWNLNVLLVATGGLRGLRNLDAYKFCQSADWRPIYMDDVSLVFLRNAPENSTLINRLQIDCSTRSLTPPASASRSALHEFYLNSGELFFVLHRDRDAEESLGRADALYREDPNIHLLKGLLFGRRQRYAEAEQELRASLAINENGGVWSSLATIYGNEGRNEAALEALHRAAGLALQPFNIYMTMGKLQIAMNHPGDALVSFAKAEKSSPYRDGGESLAPEVYAELAEGRSEAHRLLAHWNKAIAFQQEAIQRTPQVERRWDRLARLYEATGQTKMEDEVRQQMLRLREGENPNSTVSK
jgi:tetratricopeptide (TPR) repeat protein